MWIEEISSRLAARVSTDLPTEAPGRPAAVLVPLFVDQGALRLLLTRRSEQVENHAGQIAFPGGQHEEGDADLLATALRETQEEVGIEPEDVLVMGRLDEGLSVSGFRVTPFVGAIPYSDKWRPAPNEIDELLAVELARFFDPSLREERVLAWEGGERQALFYNVGPQPIWGLTARIIESLVQTLAGRPPGGEHHHV